MRGKVGITYRHYFVVRNPDDGTPASGIDPGDFTVTVRNPANDTSASPSVVEVSGGLYFFDLSGSFTATHGAGQYGVVVAVNSIAPAVVDTGGGIVDIEGQYTVKQSYSYDPDTDTMTGVVTVEQDGAIVVTPTGVSVSVYSSGGTLLFTVTDTSLDAQGVFTVSKVAPGFTSGLGYYAIASVTIGPDTVDAWKGIAAVGSA